MVVLLGFAQLGNMEVVLYAKTLFTSPRKGIMLYGVKYFDTGIIKLKEYVMPLFDFRCEECGEVSELFLRTSEELSQDKPCPKCHTTGKLTKLITGNTSFRLYGEGFYKRTHKDTGDFA